LNNQTVQNEPTAAYIVSLFGGIIGLIVSLFWIAVGVVIASIGAALGMIWSLISAIGGIFSLIGLGAIPFFAVGIWIMTCSIIVIVSASKLHSEPFKHNTWGALILIFSIAGIYSIIGFIGGILALVNKPSTAPTQQFFMQPQQRQYRICQHCGRLIYENTKFCSNCGKPFA
jgi:hypothetical protein